MQVDRRELHATLKELARVAPTRSAMPILEYVLLDAQNDTLTLTATDLKQRLSCQLPVDGDIHTCLPCKLLAQAIKPEGRASQGLVGIFPEEHQVTVMVDGLTSRIPCLPPADFPAAFCPANGESWSLLGMWPARPLADALDFVVPAASHDQTRPHLCAVLLQGQDLVATDGHRLHLAPLPATLPNALLLPASSAATLARLLPDAHQIIVARAGNLVRFKMGAWQLDTRQVEANFPPYWQVIPALDRLPTHLTVDAAALKAAITRVSRLTKDKKLKVRVNGVIGLSTWSAEEGAAEMQVPVLQSNHLGDDLLTGYEGLYLQEAIADAAEVQLSFCGALDPLRVDLAGGRIGVVMPLRL